jgi:oxysterol-binding protein
MRSEGNDQFVKYSIDNLSLNNIPEMSYSSSEDEDFFYDAQEDATSNVITSNIDPVCENNKDLDIDNFKELAMNSSKLNYDSIYEEDDEEDLGNIENHGSVISHLISQVKIGMDLTKVVLPTFILEKRSLLEMYADFFAHSDLFIR